MLEDKCCNAKEDRAQRHIELAAAITQLRCGVDTAERMLLQITGNEQSESGDKERGHEPSLAEILAGGPTAIRDQCVRLRKILADIRQSIF